MKKTLFLMLAAAGMIFAGCDRNEVDPNGKTNGENQYMAFSIEMPQTKAEGTGAPGTYEGGTTQENEINSIHFYFYRNGAYVSWGFGDVVNRFNTGQSGTTNGVDSILPAPNGNLKGVVVLESSMTKPNQVLCVINARNPEFFRNKTLNETVNALVNDGTATGYDKNNTTPWNSFVKTNGNQHFLMVNSPVYDTKNSVTYIKYAEEILEGQICDTEEAAQKNPVNIYVERACAQLRVSTAGVLDANGFYLPAKMDKSLFVDGDKSKDPLFDIEFLGWGLNGVNKNQFIVKNVDVAWKTAADFTGWLESVYRINWAKDHNYNLSITNRDLYPHTPRELLDRSQMHFYCWNEMVAHNSAADYTAGDILQRYCPENTFAKDGNGSPRIVGTTGLIMMRVRKHGAATWDDLYRYIGAVYTLNEYKTEALKHIQIDDKFYKQSGATYVPITGADLVIAKATKFNEAFPGCEVGSETNGYTYPNTVTAAQKAQYAGYVIDLSKTIVINDSALPAMALPTSAGFNSIASKDPNAAADGHVTLVPAAGLKLYVVDKSAAGYDEFDPATWTYVEATNAQLVRGFLHNIADYADHYAGGKMVYHVAIEHFGKAKDGSDNSLLTGNYGMVRNHIYNVTLGDLKTLGQPISDPEEPIVPGDKAKLFYIGATINILDWQLVTQTSALEE